MIDNILVSLIVAIVIFAAVCIYEGIDGRFGGGQ